MDYLREANSLQPFSIRCGIIAGEPREIQTGYPRSQLNLDGDSAIQPGVASTVHLAHASPAQRRKDFIRA